MALIRRGGPIHLILTLGVSGLLSGLILVTAYLATQPLIIENQRAALEAAIFRVVPGAKSRKAFTLTDGKLAEVPGEGATGDLYGAYAEDGKLVGYAIPTSGSGFQDTIKLIYGYDPHEKKIVGMEVLESRETPGLGDKILKDEKFLGNFKALDVQPDVVAVKSGTKTHSNEVDSISGATISSKSVVKIISQANSRFLPAIDAAAGGGSAQ